jgi:uncharacterized phage protein (TIGR02218 family)
MNSISTALKAHYAQETTTLASCWKVTLTNGTILGFTGNSSDIVYQGVRYLAATGHIPSAVQTSSELNVDNLEVAGLLSSASITDSDLNNGVWDFAQVQLFEVNYMDLTMGHRVIRTGTLGHVKTGRQSFQAELRGLMQSLQQTVGRIYGDTCDATLGDARCGVNLVPFTFNGTVSTSSDARTFTATMAQATGYFDFGQITWLTGANAGRKSEVRTHVNPNLFTLQLSLPVAPAIGDTFSIVAGDDKSIVTCECKFNNSANFRGFVTFPGQDRMVSGT